MIPKEIEELLNNAKPLKEPTIKQKITKSCSNCMDLIVCFSEGKFNEDPDEEENKEAAKELNEKRAKSCPDWQLDIMEYQRLIEEQ